MLSRFFIRLRTFNLCLLAFSLGLNYLYLVGKIEGAFFKNYVAEGNQIVAKTAKQEAIDNRDYVTALDATVQPVYLYDKKGRK